MKTIYLFLLVVLSGFDLYAQHLPSEYICWSGDRKLVWSDFKGQPDTTDARNLVMYAGTAASIFAFGGQVEGLPYYRISCVFENQRSWTKDTTSSELLRHEQIHFNIAELYARKMRKGVDSLRELRVDNSDIYYRYINKKLAQRNHYDFIFDKATSYSVNKTEQDEWYEKVQSELAALVEYSSDSMEYKCVSQSGEEGEDEE